MIFSIYIIMENELYKEGLNCLKVSNGSYHGDFNSDTREQNVMKKFIDNLNGLTFSELQKLYEELENKYNFLKKESDTLAKKQSSNFYTREWEYIILTDMDSILHEVKYHIKSNILREPLANIYSIKYNWLNSGNAVYNPTGYLNDVAENIKCYMNLVNKKIQQTTKPRKEETLLEEENIDILENEDIPQQSFLDIGKTLLENQDNYLYEDDDVKGGKRKIRKRKILKSKTKRHNKSIKKRNKSIKRRNKSLKYRI